MSADLYGCPRCHAVVPSLTAVRYSIGLTDLEPRWLCQACLSELRDEQQRYESGGLDARAVWGLEIVRTRGETRAATSAQRPERSPRDGARRQRTARGAVAV